MSDAFPIQNDLKQGDQGGFELNGAHQLLASGDDVDLLVEIISTIKKNTNYMRHI